MIEIITQNIGTIVAALILAAVVTMIIIRLNKNKKAGRSSCGCGCGNCPNSSICHNLSKK
ncbi:MAG: FeoB-associated Cys-rich membrane protein [Oscillospiraceae bacterium]|nr:FeoB-associated Cys-rich membrane protein [Oscillospiraceae bacterium]